jgi:predicted MFS family arabinose efflux permease
MIESITYELLMWIVLFSYIPLHLLEEALGNWPEWMTKHKYTSTKLSYGHWMAGNIFFFYPLLLIGVILYHFIGKSAFFIGLGVILWGILNFLEHFIFTIIDKKFTPGLITSLIFLFIGIITVIKLVTENDIGNISILLAIILSILYFVVPILLQMSIGEKYFKTFI